MLLVCGCLAVIALVLYTVPTLIIVSFKMKLSILSYLSASGFLMWGLSFGSTAPILFFLPSELSQHQHRSKIQVTPFQRSRWSFQLLCYTFMNLFSFLLNFALMSLLDTWLNVGAIFFFYIGPSLMSLTAIYLWLPETRGKEIHQIVAELQRGRNKQAVMDVRSPETLWNKLRLITKEG